MKINKEKAMTAIKYIYCVLLLIVLFLIALNGRYTTVNYQTYDYNYESYRTTYHIIDSWTGRVVDKK